MAEWLSSRTPLLQSRLSQFRSWVRTEHCSSSHAEAVSHIAEPEGSTTRIYNHVLGDFEEKKKKKKDWQQMLAKGQSLKKSGGGVSKMTERDTWACQGKTEGGNIRHLVTVGTYSL